MFALYPGKDQDPMDLFQQDRETVRTSARPSALWKQWSLADRSNFVQTVRAKLGTALIYRLFSLLR